MPNQTDDRSAPHAAPTRSRAIAWVDGRILPAAEATVPLTDEGFIRGDAVFEAMLVRGGRTHALEPHLQRMARSACRCHRFARRWRTCWPPGVSVTGSFA